jgi:HEAT repeat protein
MRPFKTFHILLIISLLAVLTSCGTFGPKIPMNEIPINTPEDVRRQIVELYSSSTSRRTNAITTLGEMGSRAEAAVPFLIDMLGDHTELEIDMFRRPGRPYYMSNVAAEALGKIGDPRAVIPLINAIKDKNDIDSTFKSDALIHMGERAVEPLIGLLKADDHLTRMHAAIILSNINHPRSAEALIETLSDNYFMVRFYSAQALGQIRDKQAVPALIAALDDRYGEMAAKAAWALGEIGDPRAVEPLLNKVNYKGIMTKNSAVLALMKLGTKSAEPLIAVMNKERIENATGWRLKENAVRLLGKLSTPPYSRYGRNIDMHVDTRDLRTLSIPVIIKSIKDENRTVRISAIWALGGMQASEAVEPLIPLLKDDDEHIRQNAALSLGKIKDMRAVEPLIAALSDTDDKVRENAAWALSKITGQNFRQDVEEWLEWLVEYKLRK